MLGLDDKAIKLAVEALLEILQVSGKNMELGKSYQLLNYAITVMLMTTLRS